MDIEKSKENFKDRKPSNFNCDIYRYIARDYKKPKKEQDTKKCYKCKQVRHIARDCRLEQKIKNRSVQENTDIESNKE